MTDIGIGTLMLLWIGVSFYFLPYGIASLRQHHQRHAIGILTVLLGWTGLGWILALIWASTAVRRATVTP